MLISILYIYVCLLPLISSLFITCIFTLLYFTLLYLLQTSEPVPLYYSHAVPQPPAQIPKKTTDKNPYALCDAFGQGIWAGLERRSPHMAVRD